MKRRLLLLASISGLILYGGTAPAEAATAGTATAAHHHYCVAQVPALGSRQVPVATCYSTFAQSVSAATHGRVKLPASTQAGSVTPDQINATATPGSSVIIGIDYKNINFGGDSLTLTESAACGKYALSSMPSGWNDVLSSLKTSGGCASSIFTNINFGGSKYVVGVDSSASSVDPYNDETSSQKWCPTFPC